MGGIQMTWTFRDDKQQTSTLRTYLDPAITGLNYFATAAGITPLLQAVSNAHVTSEVDPASANVAGTNAEYETVEDKAVFVLQTASGALHRYSVPAPKASIFQSDGETIDYANADVAALVTQMVNSFKSRDGTSLTASVGGYRARVKNQRRFNVFTRNPGLSGQGL